MQTASNLPPADVPLADLAEEVRAWLVQHRGGAPFLSSADGALLADWLEAGVPTVAILRGIEATAARRRARRTRTPFTLRSCKAAVEAAVREGARDAERAGEPSSAPAPAGAVAFDAAAPPSPADAPAVDPADLGAAEAALVARTRAALARVPPGNVDARVRAASALVRAFQEDLWALLAPAHAAMLAEAAEALADLRPSMGDSDFAQLCEEFAREAVRDRHPGMRIARVVEEFVRGR